MDYTRPCVVPFTMQSVIKYLLILDPLTKCVEVVSVKKATAKSPRVQTLNIVFSR